MSLSANSLLVSAPVGLSSTTISSSRRHQRPRIRHLPGVAAFRRRPISSLSSKPQNNISKPSRSLSLLSLLNSLPSKTLALPSTAAAAGALLLHLFLSPGNNFRRPGGGGGGGGAGGGGGGGDGGGGDWFGFLRGPSAAMAKENDSDEYDFHGFPLDITLTLGRMTPGKRYKVSEIEFYDKRTGETTPFAQRESLFEILSLRPGHVYTRDQLKRELKTLSSSGMLREVRLWGKALYDGTIAITIAFKDVRWRGAFALICANVGLMPAKEEEIERDSDMTYKETLRYYRQLQNQYDNRVARSRRCLLPRDIISAIGNEFNEHDYLSSRLLQWVRDAVQKWYHDEGYACAQVVNFGNLNTSRVVCELVEGDITKLVVQFQDKLGNICQGNTDLRIVRREIPPQLFPGHVFNIEAGKLALRNLNSLGLFSNIEVNPKTDEKNEGGIIVELKLRELEQKSAELNTEWSIVPGRSGKPTLASIQPGGTVSIEHRNIKGKNRSILGSITSNNLLNPQDDLSFKLEYVHPYLDGLNDSRNRTFRASCFNSRKLSPVFTGGPGAEEVPAIWVDRAGMKANIAEIITRQSKFTYGVVLEEITTRDEASSICANGSRSLPSGGLSIDGPPTTLSGTGTDRMAFLQANITRDNTRFVNGAITGGRNIFQVDQGLGIGSNFPLFNRHQLTVTRFLQLMNVEEGSGNSPPPVLVLHGHYGGCVGDLPSYDAFTLGGPYSVRGYNMGELGASRNILELAAELRIPIRNTYVYGFVEHGTDLGSSKNVKGNPTDFYRRAGHGSSYGAGVKLGLVRAEYAVDRNSGTGALFFRFGERF